MNKAGFILACSFMLALAAPASAENRDPATAEALFRQGRQSMESKNYPDACQKFAESQKLDPAAGTAMNLATCEEKLGKLASAWQHWKEAIDVLPAKDDRIVFARSRVEELEKKLPRLQVTLQSGADQAQKSIAMRSRSGPEGRAFPFLSIPDSTP
jgi:tetratricopeptide (TPR) repeat protein